MRAISGTAGWYTARNGTAMPGRTNIVRVAVSEQESLSIRYAVPSWSPSWAVPEVPVPESRLHDQAIEFLRALLLAWASRTARDVAILRNIGIRWVPSEPRAGFDPDLCFLDPAPNPDEQLTSLRLWEPGISAPRVAIEIVSPGHPYKDYVDTPERAAACGVDELWIYDPLLAGPTQHGGPFALQVWLRHGDMFTRVHAGAGPFHSRALDAWLHPAVTRRPSEARLIIADDVDGNHPWPTLVDQAEKRAEAAERELRELRAKLSGH